MSFHKQWNWQHTYFLIKTYTLVFNLGKYNYKNSVFKILSVNKATIITYSDGQWKRIYTIAWVYIFIFQRRKIFFVTK